MNTTLEPSEHAVPKEPWGESQEPFTLRLATPASDDQSLLQIASLYRATDRRRGGRYEISLGIRIQPLDGDLVETGDDFCGITREISRRGMSFVSTFPGNFKMATISLQNSDLENSDSASIVCRVCSTTLIHSNTLEKVYLTNLEFMRERVQGKAIDRNSTTIEW